MLGVAAIGTGQWGKNHARVYRELLSEGAIGSFKVCDLDPKRARELGEALGVEWVTDHRALLDDSRVQAVSIATPSKTHYPLAREFMQAGKDVLVEKPMTMDIAEAENLVQVARDSRRILMVGHIFRYHPGVRELKRRIDAGELGRIQNMIGQRLYFGLPRKDMGVIYALGIHEMDLFCYLLGVDYPHSLIAASSKSCSDHIEETAMIAMDFGYAKGYAFESWLVSAYSKLRDLVVVGSECSARIDYLSLEELSLFDSRIVADGGLPVRAEDKGMRRVSVPRAEPLKEEISHFLSCAVSRQSPLTDGLVGLRGVTMVQAALESAATGRSVKLP